MVPRSRPPLPARGRLPRPRGDGPRGENIRLSAHSVAPPTRGWSLDIGGDAQVEGGCPAHAGMVPHDRAVRADRHRLPRPRGDGPASSRSRQWASSVAPPTRGWSLPGRGAGRQHPGCPAHAGMVPAGSKAWRAPTGLPRPRGDGPSQCHSAVAPSSVAPPTRGWSQAKAGSGDGDDGCPAHAGMVPCRACAAPIRSRLPRPRGDGPVSCCGVPPSSLVAPPTRGWSLEAADRYRHAGGCPAHAGMVPHCLAGQSPHSWLPRPRGDGPSWRRTRTPSSPVAPPTRGWSTDGRRRARSHAGCPAHAGMVPKNTQLHTGPERLPRPRGDGPARSASWGSRSGVAPPTRGWSRLVGPVFPGDAGCPAHAGMVPAPGRSAGAAPRLPRPRGDGPRLAIVSDIQAAVAPPTRGWSVKSGQVKALVGGCSAHAGMVPRTYVPRVALLGLPRPRGDGPARTRPPAQPSWVAPPTRGWSLPAMEHGAGPQGCPAHAGMVRRNRKTPGR